MRLRSSPAGELLSSRIPEREDRVSGGPFRSPLIGSWAATRWQYHRRGQPPQAVDLICDLGASVTLSITAGTFILTWDLPGQGRQSIAGAVTRTDARLELRPLDAANAESLLYQVTPDTLTLSSDASAWCFDGQREETADFVAVLVHL